MSDDVDVPALARRRAERADLLERARRYGERLDPAFDVEAVVVFGSVARGDFNVWSDVDVLVVARQLPVDWRERQRLVETDRPPRVSPIAWTPRELRAELDRHNPIAVEAIADGVVVVGDRGRLTALATSQGPA